ncbi:MAG TPA: phosphatase PAP2 family protein [Candidatus Dormibacteraeota bacterium]
MRRPRAILVGSVVYLALIFGVMLWRGVSIEPEWVVLALGVIAVSMGRGRTFITDWAPFLLLFLAYEAMRGFASKTGFAPHDLSGLERAVFGGQIPTLILQHAFYRPGVVSWQDVVAMFFYFMHFPLPIVVGFIFWYNRREHYWRFIAALLLMCFAAFATYLFFPSAPPWYQFPHDVVKINNQTVAALWKNQYYVSAIYQSFNPNQFAAFPSLHAAFPTLAAVYAWNRYRWLSVGLILWSVCVLISIVYLGEHYVVDALAGLVYVASATIIVEAVADWRERRSPKAPMPATPSA